ncbi:MAG: hypothetical protein JWM34_3145 [Ilumatobacteraceae bacterium]|nr:hypothetical protein [Ilumatobacteraceae bacterium]
MDNTRTIDPAELSLDELRALRNELQHEDDALSYVRRMVQARLDLVQAERRQRVTGHELNVTEDLPVILGQHLTGGGDALPRPPRPTDDASGHPLSVELDELCSRLGANHVEQLTDDELTALATGLDDFEHARSHERRELFGRLDALSAELVRRYRDGEASVDGLLAE